MAAHRTKYILTFFLLALAVNACAGGQAQSPTAIPRLTSPDPDVAALLAMYNQTVLEASLYTPVVILHQIDTNLTWTIFHFTDAGATKEITIEVDTQQTPASDWKTSADHHSKLVGSQAADLDLHSLKAGPKRAAQALQARWPGCILRGLTLYLQNNRLTWAVYGSTSSGEVTGLMDNQTGVFQAAAQPPGETVLTATPGQ